jgi:glutathione S-transferase
MLEELGLEYQLQILPFPPRVLAKPFLAINPLGTVPYFIDDEVTMTESSMICHYLAERYSPQSLAVSSREPGYGAYLNFVSFGEATLTFPLAICMRYSRVEVEERRLPQAVMDYRRFFFGRLRLVDRVVSKEDYLCSGRFTAADISVGYALLFAQMLGLQDEFPEAVTCYLQRLMAREGFIRAVRAENGPTVSSAST